MKKAKKWLAILLAVLTAAALTAFAPAANAAVSQQTAQQVVSALGIMVGDDSGNMNLDSTLTRSQMAKILVKLSSGNITLSAATSPFPDVPYTNWAAPYVSKAVSLGYINGLPDGTFKPEQSAKTEELAKTLLAVLGYTSADFGVGYPWAQVNYAQKLGLLSGISSQVGSPITRRDVMYMAYNTLNAVAKSGKKYAVTLGYATTASGDLDVSSILNANSVGPITVRDSSWFSTTGLGTTSLAVYLNDKPATLGNVLPYDIVYYSVTMKTVWAYDKKVTGILQNVLPSRTSPTSVVVAGTTYTLGNSAATAAASYQGGFSFGDAVTLLFDRNGGVADIIPADASATLTGYVAGTGNKLYTNPDGSTYNSYYITLVSADGSKSEYQFSYDPSGYAGTVVTVGFANGAAEVTSSASAAVSGAVSYTGMTIGTQKMSPGIQILDVDSYGSYVSVFPQRLDGITLTSSSVLFCRTDATGTVTQLILNGVTGDMAPYGILTSVIEKTSGMSLSGSYTYNIAGATGTLKTTNMLYNVSVGPAVFRYQGGSIVSIKQLTALGRVTLSGSFSAVTASGAQYLLSDQVVIYQQSSNGLYSIITASQASGLTLTAYNDKAQSDGGRIRVIMAQ